MKVCTCYSFVLFLQAAASLLFCAVLTFPHCASQLLALIIYSPPPPILLLLLIFVCFFLSIFISLLTHPSLSFTGYQCVSLHFILYSFLAFSPCVHILVFMAIVCLQIRRAETMHLLDVVLIASSNNSSNPRPTVQFCCTVIKTILWPDENLSDISPLILHMKWFDHDLVPRNFTDKVCIKSLFWRCSLQYKHPIIPVVVWSFFSLLFCWSPTCKMNYSAL